MSFSLGSLRHVPSDEFFVSSLLRQRAPRSRAASIHSPRHCLAHARHASPPRHRRVSSTSQPHQLHHDSSIRPCSKVAARHQTDPLKATMHSLDRSGGAASDLTHVVSSASAARARVASTVRLSSLDDE